MYDFVEGNLLTATDGDLYLVVVTSDVLYNQMTYSKQGLYSAALSLQDITKATRVRVELKVNREGKYSVVNNPHTLLPSISSPLSLYNEDNKAYTCSLFPTGQKIAIGNQIATVGNSVTDNTLFNLGDVTYAPANVPVYRLGYKVQAKACVNSINEDSPLNPITKKDYTLIDLPLIAIIPGKESGLENISSDRLIFEAEIKTNESGYILKSFNELEVQIF